MADESEEAFASPSSRKFYLRSHGAHGVEDRPNYLTVRKNKYGADYPTAGRYVPNNRCFTDFMLGKSGMQGSQANSLEHSPRSSLSIDSEEILSPNFQIEQKFRDNRKRKFKQEKSEQGPDDEIKATLGDSIIGAIEPLTLEVACIVSPIKKHPPTNLDVESVPKDEYERQQLLEKVGEQVRKQPYTLYPEHKRHQYFLEFPILFKDGVEATQAKQAIKRQKKVRNRHLQNPTPDDHVANALRMDKVVNDLDMVGNVYRRGDQPFLTQREPKTEEFLHDLYK